MSKMSGFYTNVKRIIMQFVMVDWTSDHRTIKWCGVIYVYKQTMVENDDDDDDYGVGGS